MAHAGQQTHSDMTFGLYLGRGLREAGLWMLVCVGLYLLFALISYTPQDPGWSYSGPSSAPVHNAGGPVGAWFADVLLYLFGYCAFVFPILVAWSARLIFRRRRDDLSDNIHILPLHWLGFVITLATGAALADLYIHHPTMPLPVGPGGVLGQSLAQSLVVALHPLGSTLLLVSLFLSGFTLLSGLSWLTIMDWVGGWTLQLVSWSWVPILGLYRGLRQLSMDQKANSDEQTKQVPVDPRSGESRDDRAERVRIEPRMPVIEASGDTEGAPSSLPSTEQPPLGPNTELPLLNLLDPLGLSDKGTAETCQEDPPAATPGVEQVGPGSLDGAWGEQERPASQTEAVCSEELNPPLVGRITAQHESPYP